MTMAELKKIFDGKRQGVSKRGILKRGFNFITFPAFQNWFNLDVFNQGCHYCGLKNEVMLSTISFEALRDPKWKKGTTARTGSFEPNSGI